jgi:uncharacterized protein (TIGR03437 family)
LLLVLLWIGLPLAAQAQAVRTNPGFSANSVPRNDDGSSAEVAIGFLVNFFGQTFTTTYVNNNGNITFGGSLSTFTPQGLTGSPLRIIAPFWADVDTRAAGSALVTYGNDTVDGHRAFGVNWVNVGYYGNHDDKLNSFQLVLIERLDIGPGNFDIEFNYDRILWETGDASGGSGGLGGTSASAGYSNGSGKAEDSFEILGSRINGIFLDNNRNGLRYRRLNSTVRGRLVFFVREGSVECTYGALSIDEIFPWQGGLGTVQVAAPFGCEWSATSNVGFIIINSGATGSGNGIVEYAVAENRSSRPRNGTLTVAGEIIPVAQEAFVTLRVTPPTLRLSSVEGTFPNRVVFQIEPIEDEVSWSASGRLLNGEVWRFRATPESGVATKVEPSTVVLELNPTFTAPLPGAVYEAILSVRDTVEGPVVEVPLILSVSPSSGNLELSQSAFVFRASEGGPSPAPQTLHLTNSGSGVLSWSIPLETVQSAPWLSVSALNGTAVTGTPAVSSTTLSVNSSGLAPGTYQTLLELATSAGTSHPQFVTVTLHVVPATAGPIPAVSPNGLLFVAREGEPAPAAQNLTISNIGSQELRFDLSTSTVTGGNWLRVTSSASSTGSGPATVAVAVDPAGLPAGIYQGSVDPEFSTETGTSVPVFLIVAPRGQRTLFGTTVCTPQAAVLVPISLGRNATMSASFPQPLLVRVLDSCGEPVNNVLILVGAEGNRIVLRPVGRGLYSGTWTPQLIAPVVPVKFTALHALYGVAERTVVVSTADPPGGVSLPSLATDGVVDAAGFAQGLPLAPGSIISIFGAGFVEEAAVADQLPLGHELGGVSVTIGRETAPLFYVGPGQINAQLPFSAVPGSTVSVVVNAQGKLSAPQQFLIASVQPNIFEQDGTAFATDQQSQRISPENPARLGQPLQIFATGLGLVDQLPGAGSPSPASSKVLNPVRVRIGGVDAPVSFQGLAPGFVGLYQINVFLPGIVQPGDEVTVVLEQNGIPSNASFPVTIPVRNP